MKSRTESPRGRGQSVDPIDFLNEVLAALFERLDTAFPEFGWQRDSRGWVATDRQYTKQMLGARTDRVICHQPVGFYVHGGSHQTWMAYVNGGESPRGAAFFEAVRRLAGLAAIDPSVLDREPSPEALARNEERARRRGVLQAARDLACENLRSPRGEAARAYLRKRRGLSDAEIRDLGLGLYPTVAEIRKALEAEGEDIAAAEAAGLLWGGIEGYIVIPWADADGRPLTFYGRWPGEPPEGRPKTMALPGEGTKGSPLYFDLARKAGHREIVAVEGVFDAALLQVRGDRRVVAYAGAQFSAGQVTTLARHKVRSVVLVPDPDGGGDQGAARSSEALARAGIPSYVAPRLPDGQDPDEFLLRVGIEEWRAHVARAAPGAVFRGTLLLEGITPASEDQARRRAVERVLDLRESLSGPSIGLDGADLLRLLEARTGYPPDALAEQAEARAASRRREEEDRATRKALREAQASLDKGKGGAEVADRLSADLAAIRVRPDDLPPTFSVDRLERESASTPEGKSLGWRAVDDLGAELHPGELAILAGRTGHGKTTVMVNVFANLLRDAEDRGADEVFVFYSAEESEVRIYHRLLALVATADVRGPWTVNEVRDFLQGREMRTYPSPSTLEQAREILRAWEGRIVVVHRPGWTVDEIEADARRRARDRPVGAVLVDYLQRIYAPKDLGKGRRRDEEVSLVARHLKVLAGDLATPVVTGAQINRKAVEEAGGRSGRVEGSYGDPKVTEALKKRRPQLHHLREGGSEQEADLVLGLMNYAADFAEDAEQDSVPPATRLEVGTLKNRYGSPGRWAPLVLEGRYGRIRDAHPQDRI
jgi:replicative DNA helicase